MPACLTRPPSSILSYGRVGTSPRTGHAAQEKQVVLSLGINSPNDRMLRLGEQAHRGCSQSEPARQPMCSAGCALAPPHLWLSPRPFPAATDVCAVEVSFSLENAGGRRVFPVAMMERWGGVGWGGSPTVGHPSGGRGTCPPNCHVCGAMTAVRGLGSWLICRRAELVPASLDNPHLHPSAAAGCTVL